jgi:hypothetical protein
MGRLEPSATEVELAPSRFSLDQAASRWVFSPAGADEGVRRVSVPVSRRLHVDPERDAGEVVQDPAHVAAFSGAVCDGAWMVLCGSLPLIGRGGSSQRRTGVVNQRVERSDLVVYRLRPDGRPTHRLDGMLGQLASADHVRSAGPVRLLGHPSLPGEVPERRHWVVCVVRRPPVRSQALAHAARRRDQQVTRSHKE